MVTKTRLTYQDYMNTPDDERCELINGELFMAPCPSIPHQGNQTKLGWRMAEFVERCDLGMIFFSDTDVVQPDLIFVSKEREGIITHDNIQGAPDLVVEILSPSTSRRDWTEKRELYAQHEVREYLVMDPSNRIVWRMLKGWRAGNRADLLRRGHPRIVRNRRLQCPRR